MRKILLTWSVLFSLVVSASGSMAAERTISREEFVDRVSGYWIGQLAGNYVGFPFESVCIDEPCPVFIDRYYNYQNAGTAEDPRKAAPEIPKGRQKS